MELKDNGSKVKFLENIYWIEKNPFVFKCLREILVRYLIYETVE